MKLDDSLRTTKGSIRVIFTLNTPPKDHWIIRRFFDLDPGHRLPAQLDDAGRLRQVPQPHGRRPGQVRRCARQEDRAG
jgi:hypothetical protein